MNKILKNILIILIILFLIFAIYLLLFKKQIVTFKINEENAIIKIGYPYKILYTISNNNIKITWESSNNSIATVNNNGEVIGNNVGSVIITGKIDSGQTIYCFIEVKEENFDIPIEDIILPDGEILVSTINIYQLPITYVPQNAYTKNIQYIITNNNIAKIENNQIIGLQEGRTILKIIANNVTKEIPINVTSQNISSQIISTINALSLIETEEINVNEKKQIKYNIEPSNSLVFNTLWESSNNDVATVDNEGIVTGLKSGTTVISLTINNYIKKSIVITIKQSITDIKFDYIPKQILKVGETYTLYPTIVPISNTDNLVYESSNSNIIDVENNGLLIPKSMGNTTITIKNSDNSVNKKLSFTVLNQTGVINSTQYIWAFNKEGDAIPKKADKNFFITLASQGIGIVKDNQYIYQKYTYDISNSTLIINNSNKIFMRFYYPPNKDLSSLNTFTFIGGAGSQNFGGSFAEIEKDTSLIKSSGIIILICEGNIKVYKENVVEATKFVKLIINQNKNARNNIGGYSNGGPIAGEAAEIGNYNKIMLINTSFYLVNSKKNISNKEIVVYSANKDSWVGTSSFISELYLRGIKNVTIISNNPSMSNSFGNKYLVIDPGNAMENGHTSNNLIKAHYFSYGCD